MNKIELERMSQSRRMYQTSYPNGLMIKMKKNDRRKIIKEVLLSQMKEKIKLFTWLTQQMTLCTFYQSL